MEKPWKEHGLVILKFISESIASPLFLKSSASITSLWFLYSLFPCIGIILTTVSQYFFVRRWNLDWMKIQKSKFLSLGFLTKFFILRLKKYLKEKKNVYAINIFIITIFPKHGNMGTITDFIRVLYHIYSWWYYCFFFICLFNLWSYLL